MRGSGRFAGGQGGKKHVPRVSIPFIAGQWSLLRWTRARRTPPRRAFQSPSLRGSGHFPRGSARTSLRRACFNPLHCGAVVASALDLYRPPLRDTVFQSPSLRGQWSLQEKEAAARRAAEVSIPFIAGQWSLPALAAWREAAARVSQSPSLRGSGRFGRATLPCPPPPRCLNPLHCGAVVASSSDLRIRPQGGTVSIPFIAGQWSLRMMCCAARAWPHGSQSPSLRGSGRFGLISPRPRRFVSCLNPLHCGAVVASMSITQARTYATLSQSPSLRGSGRFRRQGDR